MYVFSIDIPFKGKQSLSNMRSKVTTASMTPLCHVHPSQISLQKAMCRIICEDIRKKVAVCNQLCWLSSWIWSHIRKGFSLCIRGPGEVVWWKKQRSKISCQGPFNLFNLLLLPFYGALIVFPRKINHRQNNKALILLGEIWTIMDRVSTKLYFTCWNFRLLEYLQRTIKHNKATFSRKINMIALIW
jgi:hypothetical protein